jgi:hypothetical protein
MKSVISRLVKVMCWYEYAVTSNVLPTACASARDTSSLKMARPTVVTIQSPRSRSPITFCSPSWCWSYAISTSSIEPKYGAFRSFRASHVTFDRSSVEYVRE